MGLGMLEDKGTSSIVCMAKRLQLLTTTCL